MNTYGFLKVAAGCPKIRVADPQHNAEAALQVILAAREEQIQLLVLPELYLSGCSCGDLFRQDTLILACESALAFLLEQTAELDMLCVVGLPVRAAGRLCNCAAVLQGGKLLGLVPKRWLSAEERRCFSPGFAEIGTARLCGQEVPFGELLFEMGTAATIAVELGADCQAPVSPGAAYVQQGADLVVNLSAEVLLVGEDIRRGEWLRQRSAACVCGSVYASAGPGESTSAQLYSGACGIAENGMTLSETEPLLPEGSFVSACIDTTHLRALRRNSPFWENVPASAEFRVPAGLPELESTRIDRVFEPHPFVPRDGQERVTCCREVLEIQARALAKRLEYTGIRRLILGLSGGLDSALALLACARAMALLGLPAEEVLCLSLPGFGTTERTRQNAARLAASLGAELREIDIRPACTQHMQDIGHDMLVRDVTYENSQARERTQILMDLANQEDALLVGTGNMSELALGWCTYGGDQMSMYAVNAGLSKTLLRRVVEWYAAAASAETRAALEDILATPVSPELLPPDGQGLILQKTEEVLGPYEVHDFFLYHFLRFSDPPNKLLFLAERAFAERYSPEQLRDWLKLFLRRFFSQQFKRACLPDSPAMVPLSLSPRGGWQMPSDAQAEAWLAEFT